MVDDANHGQVASGDIPSFVTESDIPSPISFEEAHTRYVCTLYECTLYSKGVHCAVQVYIVHQVFIL